MLCLIVCVGVGVGSLGFKSTTIGNDHLGGSKKKKGKNLKATADMLPPFLNNPLISVADKQSAMNRQMGVLTDDGQGKQGQLKGTQR